MGWIAFLIFPFFILTFVIVREIVEKKENKNKTQTRKPQETKYDEWKKYFDQLRQQQETEEEICKRIGNEGEEEVADILGKTIEDVQYVFNNIIIKNRNNQTSQIDHIFINENGIWVIETKNFSGHIYGKENERQWTQFNNYGAQKTFYNPIKQNATHIYNLKEIIGKDTPVNNLIVFVNANIERIETENVINIEDLWETLWTEEEVKITKEEMKKWYTKIKEATKNNITEEEHIQGIKTKQENLEKGICPRCGGKLILRKGEYGEFYGCSNYPNCKFTKNI